MLFFIIKTELACFFKLMMRSTVAIRKTLNPTKMVRLLVFRLAIQFSSDTSSIYWYSTKCFKHVLCISRLRFLFSAIPDSEHSDEDHAGPIDIGEQALQQTMLATTSDRGDYIWSYSIYWWSTAWKQNKLSRTCANSLYPCIL